MNPHQRPAPIAVVGGGIAGAAACISLARAGHQALWLAPAAGEDADPVGESLSPAAGPMLGTLGLEGLLHAPPHRPSHTIFMSWGGRLTERNAAVHLEGPGWVLNRHRFEADLRATAAAGADVLPVALRQAIPDGAGWRLFLSSGEERFAGFLIDATGRAASFGRKHAAYRRVDRQVAATALLTQQDTSVEPTAATLIEAVEEGWWYAALLPDGRLSLAYFSDPDLMPAGISHDPAAWRGCLAQTTYVGRWVTDAGFGSLPPPRLTSAGTARLEPPAGLTESGAGWAAIGDAAAAFDPLSSHGMTTALWTAHRASQAALAFSASQPDGLFAYASAVTRGFENFLSQRTAIYAREGRYAEAIYWRRRRAVPLR